VEETARRLGLGLWEKGMAYGRREPRGAEPVSEDELRAAAALIERVSTTAMKASMSCVFMLISHNHNKDYRIVA